MEKMLRDKRVIFLLVFPGFAVFAFSVLVPIALSVYFGMTDWSGIGSFSYVGLENFRDVLQDRVFWNSLKNAAMLALAMVFVQHPLCMFFAILLDHVGGRAEKVFRAILFIPVVISIMVTSKMWVHIYDPQFGLLNKVLDLLNLKFLERQWLGDPRTVLGSIIVIVNYQGFGWGMIIYYAGIKNLPVDVYEACRIDGANALQQFFYVTMPLLKPVIGVNTTLAVISSLKQMETVYLTTNGGPGNLSQFPANYLYTKAFSSFEYGYGNAISVLFVTVCLLVTVIMNRMFRSNASDR